MRRPHARAPERAGTARRHRAPVRSAGRADRSAVASAPSGSRPAGDSGLSEITGKFTYTNDIITTYYVEHAAGLVDMYGFVIRDKEWEIPVDFAGARLPQDG